jgi:hypothetical protein
MAIFFVGGWNLSGELPFFLIFGVLSLSQGSCHPGLSLH